MSFPYLILYADGGSRGNPGPAGAGAYLSDPQGNPVAELKQYLGETTNNVAEYSALILGLKHAAALSVPKIWIRMDSQLVVRQIEGAYRVKQAHLQVLHREALTLLKKFTAFKIEYIPREKNQQADRLANEAMDEKL